MGSGSLVRRDIDRGVVSVCDSEGDLMKLIAFSIVSACAMAALVFCGFHDMALTGIGVFVFSLIILSAIDEMTL